MSPGYERRERFGTYGDVYKALFACGIVGLCRTGGVDDIPRDDVLSLLLGSAWDLSNLLSINPLKCFGAACLCARRTKTDNNDHPSVLVRLGTSDRRIYAMNTISQFPCLMVGMSRLSKSTFFCSSFSFAGRLASGVRERPYSPTLEKRSEARTSRKRCFPVAPVAPKMRAARPVKYACVFSGL